RWRETAYSRCTSHPFSRVVMTSYLKEQTHQIKKTIFGWVILLYPKLPSEFVFKFGGIFLCPFFGQLSICSYEAKFINT
ncbi:hypothetical protein, partial [Streptococcus suis]|uniref:hypothetical protein n=1 Tax=Streptococcus suis TaxID=1307 RepID=UPI001F479607